jgi:hypothetical protein
VRKDARLMSGSVAQPSVLSKDARHTFEPSQRRPPRNGKIVAPSAGRSHRAKYADVSPSEWSTRCESPVVQDAGCGGLLKMKRHRHTPEQVMRVSCERGVRGEAPR